jgi:hypothetical protein
MALPIIGGGSEKDNASIGLATREGNYIPNERRLEQSPARLKEAARLWQDKYPSIKLRSLSAKYNCMGLIFASRRTWVDPKFLYDILREDEYKRIDNKNDAAMGDVVVYQNKQKKVAHVALIADVKIDVANAVKKLTLISQWGCDGEYVHLVDETPEVLFGKVAEYWTDRKLP